MMAQDFEAVEEGDKVEFDDEEGVYVVESIVVSVRFTPANSGLGFADDIKLDKGEVVQKIEDGELTNLTAGEGPSTAAGREIREHVDIEALVDACEGRNGLRTTKPDGTSLEKFVWRMARFHSGADPCMPVKAHWHLQDYVDEHLEAEASVSGVLDDAGKDVTDQLEKAVDAVIVSFNENPAMGAKRWEKAGAI